MGMLITGTILGSSSADLRLPILAEVLGKHGLTELEPSTKERIRALGPESGIIGAARELSLACGSVGTVGTYLQYPLTATNKNARQRAKIRCWRAGSKIIDYEVSGHIAVSHDWQQGDLIDYLICLARHFDEIKIIRDNLAELPENERSKFRLALLATAHIDDSLPADEIQARSARFSEIVKRKLAKP